MFTITEQDEREEAEAVHKLLLGVSVALVVPALIIPFAGPALLPIPAFAFLVSMTHGVFLFTRYPTVCDIRWQSWVMYGLSLVPSAFALSYGLRVAGPHVFAVAFIVLFLVLSVVFSRRRNRRLIVLQWLLIVVGLIAVPVYFAVRDYRALYDTIQAGQTGHLRFLLALGADVSGTNSTLLHAALSDVEMMHFLLDQGADPNAADDIDVFDKRTSTTSLLAVVVSADRLGPDKQLAMLRLLLERGADPNRENSDALFRAVSANSVPMVDLLVEHGGNIHAQDAYGRSLLFSANTRELARYLVERGVRLDVRNQWGQTALFEVAQSDDVDPVAYLVEQGMDVNARANDGSTPLIATVSAAGSRSETVQYLLAQGADPHARDNQGRTAADFARAQNVFDIAALLEAAMAQ